MAISDLPGDINQTKKRQRINSFSDNQSPSAPAGTQRIASGVQLMPAQQKEQAQSAQREVMGQRIAQTRENVSSAVGNAAGAVGKGYSLIADIATTVPRAAAALGGGIAERGITFDSNLPGQERRDRNNAIQAKNFVRDNPEQAAAGQQYGQRIADRTVSAGAQNLIGPASQSAPAPSAPPSPGVARLMGNLQAPAPSPALGGNQAITQPASRMFPDNAGSGEFGNVGYGGIVGRRNEQGVQEFSNMQSDVASASGRRFADPDSNVGNGTGRLSILSGMDEAMARNNRATQIMQEGRQQDRLERQNPNYVTTIRDSGASGMQGQINQTLNKLEAGDRADRTANQQDRIERGRNRLAELTLTREDQNMARQQMDQTEQRNQLGDRLTGQAITQGSLELETQQRLSTLQSLIASPLVDEASKNDARRALQDLTNSGRDRFLTVTGGKDGMGATQASQVFDTATQQFVEQARDMTGDPEALEIRGDKSMTREQKAEALRLLGYK